MRYGLNIRGLTTAAIIFTASAVGLACGAALYVPALLTMLALAIVLFIMNRLEKKIFPAAKSKLKNGSFKCALLAGLCHL